MQSIQFKSDSVTSNLTLNPATPEAQIIPADSVSPTLNLLDPSFNDSLSIHYIAPDSVIYWGFRPEWSQFRKAYTPEFNYQKDLVRQLPYDSLHTVLKGVEVVFPGKKLARNNPDWLVGILVLAFLLFATVRLIFNKYLTQLLQATINYSTFTRIFRERYFNLLHASFRLDLIFNMILALFGYQFINAYKINFGISNTFSVYLVCLGAVIGYFTAKRIIYFLIGMLTESKQEVREYLFSISVFNRVLGLFLLPVSATIAFVPLAQVEPVLFTGLGLVAIFYLMSLIRGAKIFLKKQFSISYLILYLCTLEFLPLLLIYNILLT
ncbi:MAG: DUF4271 domain-containing protein [Prolixibacteraceae bacterium]|nr:DUF4271 domain-containing protein [Prolixibacteraceae bacterium]